MSYLEQFIGNMNKDMLRRFLRLCLCKKITIEFNGLLELSSTYTTYPEFVSEFERVLSQPENCWTITEELQHVRNHLRLH